MLSLCWPGRATVAVAWPPAFPSESCLADYEPIRAGKALGSGSFNIPPLIRRFSHSAWRLAVVLYFVLCLSDGCDSPVFLGFVSVRCTCFFVIDGPGRLVWEAVLPSVWLLFISLIHLLVNCNLTSLFVRPLFMYLLKDVTVCICVLVHTEGSPTQLMSSVGRRRENH